MVTDIEGAPLVNSFPKFDAAVSHDACGFSTFRQLSTGIQIFVD